MKSKIMNYEKTILKLNDWALGTNIVSYLKEFRKTKKFTKEELMQYQFNKLKNLLIYAEKHSPFYQERFKLADFHVNELNCFENLRKIPVLTREEIIKYQDKILTDGYKANKLQKSTSSGSTGSPVIVYKDSNAISAGIAAGMIARELTPWRFGIKGLHIWGTLETVNRQWKKPASKVKAMLFNNHKFAAPNLTETGGFDKLYQVCKRKKYIYLDGYTMAIYMFAKYLKEMDLRIPSVRYVLPTAENLQGYQKQTIEEILGPVYDLYGCSEINGIAHQCAKCGLYHNMDMHVFTEFSEPVNDDGDCKFIITDLDNYAFPLIRYENGDLVVPEKNNLCEVPFSSYKSVSGRIADLIVLENGGILSIPGFFGSTIFPGIKQYQGVRDAKDHLIIKLVVDESFSKENLEIVKNEVSDYLSGHIKWDIEFVENIPVGSNGKTKLVVDLTK